MNVDSVPGQAQDPGRAQDPPLRQQVERAIVTGDLAVDRLWSLAELADRFAAPAGQVARVAQAAWRKGLLEPVTGDTWRVVGLPTNARASVFTHTAAAGFRPRSEVRQAEVEAASPVVASRLRLEAGSPVYRYVRTRWVNDEALANQTNYMPYEVCPGLEHRDVSRYSFQKLLEETYHAVLVEMQEEVALVDATEADREVLGLPEGASVLVVDRIALSASGWPLVWADIRIRPDRFDYVAALWPQAARLFERSQVQPSGDLHPTPPGGSA